ncbi:MAG: hypothetical protein A4E49_01790 [Methanosaeta sp. PtaU1.Bin112]|nr:MAG: hypothetical protein A4E49_01790 [Methanosaeta sp. PtaU1.Bin112]
MKLAYILLALALLVPLAFSTPANDVGTQFAGEVIDVGQIEIDHAQDAAVKVSEKVFVGSIKSNKYGSSLFYVGKLKFSFPSLR